MSSTPLQLMQALPTPAERPGLEQVLRHPAIWRAQQAVPNTQGLATGYKALDQLLPDSGWPAAALTELLVSASGGGELSLLLPALRRLCQEQDQALALLGAPWLPQARTWEQAGIPLERLLLVDSSGNDLLWAAEQVLRSGECSAVLVWAASAGSALNHRALNHCALNHRALQRLQLAASSGNTRCFLYRPFAAETSPSPAPLRLRLAAQAGDLQVQVLKCRGAAPAKALRLRMFPAHWNTAPSALPSSPAVAAAAPAAAAAGKTPRPVSVQLSLV